MGNKNKKILIVEDEQVMLNILSDRLELEGFQVSTAQDGEEGLAKALEEHPDVIVLDILMPKMSGSEMLQRLKNDDWGREVHVICLTNLEETPEEVKRIMDRDATVDYIVKYNTRLDKIIERICELVQ